MGQVKQGAEHSFSADFRVVTRSHGQKWVHAEGSLMVNGNEERGSSLRYTTWNDWSANSGACSRCATPMKWWSAFWAAGPVRLKFDKQMTLLEVSEGWSRLMKPPGRARRRLYVGVDSGVRPGAGV